MNLTTLLSIVGLGLALIELYVPKLSLSLEVWMKALVGPFLTAAKAVESTPDMVGSALDRLTKKTLPGLLFLGLPALIMSLVFAGIAHWETAGFFTLGIVVITLMPLGLSVGFRFYGGYIAYPAYALAFALASPAWLIQFANKIGNGKGLSGFGLMLAFWGVFEPLIQGG